MLCGRKLFNGYQLAFIGEIIELPSTPSDKTKCNYPVSRNRTGVSREIVPAIFLAIFYRRVRNILRKNFLGPSVGVA